MNNAIPELYHLPGCHEPISALSHLAGAVAFLLLGGLLVWRGRGNGTRMTLLTVYVASCVGLLVVSGVYHLLPRGSEAHRFVLRLDHAAIFVFIAGSFTAGQGLLFHGWRRWAPILAIWAAAVTGILLRCVFYPGMAEALGLGMYLVLGWACSVSAVAVARRYGFVLIEPLLLGGVVMSAGGTMEYFYWPVLLPGVIHAHEVLHLSVLVGIYFHWLFVWQFAPGEVTARWRRAGMAHELRQLPVG
jgi:channel protein (hemolysin III family)